MTENGPTFSACFDRTRRYEPRKLVEPVWTAGVKKARESGAVPAGQRLKMGQVVGILITCVRDIFAYPRLTSGGSLKYANASEWEHLLSVTINAYSFH